MPKIAYQTLRLSANKLSIIETANSILDEYAEQGLDLTLRQLYYQFVARGIIPNRQNEYAKLGDIVSDGRLAGLIDWGRIVDRTRFVRQNSHWQSPANIVESASTQYRIDRWSDQEAYVEVWIEKDALIGVIEDVCKRMDIPYFSCRGYTSMSEMWSAGQRLIDRERHHRTIILHLGDHDPSGIDMSRDIQERLRMFGSDVEVRRLALTMDQIETFDPPPNPAKITDSRSGEYIRRFGNESWELDALDPKYLISLIEGAIDDLEDEGVFSRKIFEASEAREKESRQLLKSVAVNWDSVSKGLKSKD